VNTHPIPMTTDHTPLSLTVSGELAAALRREARNLGWSLEDVVRHVVCDLTSGDLPTDADSTEDGPWAPEQGGTFVTVHTH
jgi:hypothetical protein